MEQRPYEKKSIEQSLGYRLDSDPSPLTTAQILREVSSLKELLVTRIEGMEEAIKVAHQDLVRFPTDIQQAVSNLKDLHDEKFNSINIQIKDWGMLRDEKFNAVEKQFKERDIRIEKSEANTTKQIDAQGVLITTTTKGLEDKIGDVKDRVTNGLETRLSGMEGRLTGIEQRAGGRKDLWGYAVAAIMLMIAIAAFIMPHLK